MRWPFGPPHLTLKPSKKNTKTKKETKKTEEKTNKKRKKKPKKKQQKYPKISFSIISQSFLFLGGFSKFPFFDTLAQKARTQKNTIKIGVSGPFFWKADVRHETAIFGKKKPKFINFSYHFFLPIFFSFNNKKPQNCWNPYFYSVIANQKWEFSKKIT